MDRAMPDLKAKLTNTEPSCFGGMRNVCPFTAKRVAPENFPESATPVPLSSLPPRSLYWFSCTPPPSSLLKPMSEQFYGKSHTVFKKLNRKELQGCALAINLDFSWL